MQSKTVLLSLVASLLGATQAQQCQSDAGLAQSLLTCMTNVPTATSVNQNMSQASSTACAYAKSVLSCYSEYCDGTLPAQASVFVTESSIYCNGNYHPSTTTGTVSATSTGTSKTSSRTGSVAAASTMSTSSNTQSTRSSTTSMAAVSSYSSKGMAPQGYTMYVKEVIFIAVAGMIGEMVL